MATKTDAALAQKFKQTAAFAKKLAKPFKVTLYIPDWARESMKANAKAGGISLDLFISLALSGGMRVENEQLDWVLGDFRDDAEAED